VTDWKNPVYANMIAAVTPEAVRRGFHVEVVPWPAHNQADEVQRLVRRGFDAACAIGFRSEQMISLHLLHEQGLPVLALNRFSTELHVPSVRFDDETPAYAIAEGLIRLGHRNLCMVTHSDRGAGADGRITGWFRCLEDYGLTGRCSMPFYINAAECFRQFYNQAFIDVYASRHGPTAIVFAHATLAARFIRDKRLAAKRVPEELSLAYFGTDPRVERASWCPPLTTIVPDMHRVAECILETVERLLASDRSPPTIRVPMEIHYTESIGPGPCAGELLARGKPAPEDRRGN
jgi:LacI family transcriptional regulator